MSFKVDVVERGFDQVINGLVLTEIAIQGDLTLEDLVIIGERTLELARIDIPFDTGAAHDSLQMFVDKNSFRVVIGSDGGIRPDGVRRIYLRYLELGTSKIQARPFLVPSLLTAVNEFRTRYPEKIREFSRIHVNLNRSK